MCLCGTLLCKRHLVRTKKCFYKVSVNDENKRKYIRHLKYSPMFWAYAQEQFLLYLGSPLTIIRIHVFVDKLQLDDGGAGGCDVIYHVNIDLDLPCLNYNM